MSDTPRTDAAQWTAGIGADDRMVVWSDFARHLERELAAAQALVSERESRLANIKFLLEPIYGSTNYAPIGGTLDRVLDICDRFEVPSDLRADIAAKTAALERAQEALKPFAEIAKYTERLKPETGIWFHSSNMPSESYVVTVQHVRDAARAASTEEGAK